MDHMDERIPRMESLLAKREHPTLEDVSILLGEYKSLRARYEDVLTVVGTFVAESVAGWSNEDYIRQIDRCTDFNKVGL